MPEGEYRVIQFLAPARQSVHNERVQVPVAGGILTFEKDEVPSDLLDHPENYYLLESLTGVGPIKKASYIFRSTEPDYQI